MNDALKRHPIFHGVSPTLVDKLMRSCERKRFRKGEFIVKQGDVALEVFIFLEGKFEVFYLSREGIKTTIIYHEAPHITGEIEVFDNHRYLANVVAMEPCDTLRLTKKKYLELLHSNHQICINIVKLLSNLLCQTGEDRRVKFFGRVDHLLANLLCYHASMFGERHSYGILVKKEINKKEMAESLAVARRSIIEAFKKLQEEKLIYLEGKQLVIPNLAALQHKAKTL